MNVHIILEDALNDKFIASPIIQAAFQFIERPAKVTVSQERMGSVEQAMDLDRLRSVIEEREGMVQLFLLLVDRDCRAPGRQRGGDRAGALLDLENRVQAPGYLGANQHFIACQAIEELEVWLLAGFDRPSWREIRNHCDPKEAFFEPFARERGLSDEVAEGRRELMDEAVRRYPRIRRLCPELQDLEQRLAQLP